MLAARECAESVAWAASIQGRVELKSLSEPHWRAVRQGDRFCPGDRLRVSPNGRAGLILHNESLLRLAENSNVRFSAPSEEGTTFFLDLRNGIAHIISRIRHSLQVNTPYVNAHTEGTEFTVESGSDGALVTVLEGQAIARNEQGEVRVNSGQRATSRPGEAPRGEAVVNPRDAVQWALYYPPVVEPPVEHVSEAVRQSLAAYRRGDLSSAFRALAEEPGVEEDAGLLVYRASLHLQVGGMEPARRDLAAVLNLRAEQADALALLSLIATTNNEYRQAMEMARQAVRADGQSASAYLALSYAHQARFQLSEAREAAAQATLAAPENALAWARLARLELMFRNLEASTEAASRAVEIAPARAQSQTTLGFARLIQFDLEGAREAFERAAFLDQAAPLPRLGLGLVRIRKGDVAEGRRQLEIAANLDPGNALIRSYLGKAYYEEKRDSLAATQFTLAKQFDDLDPTAWFYDAIRKQADNRPIEALKDIQTSIDLNDNRAVYRSRLLLDQDEAARGASQARIYQDLGFDQLARNEAYKSLQTSAINHSAHRLLADSYSGQPRYEKARMSERLQFQLLQPLNTTPIQPQLAVSNPGILDGAGPSAGAFSEYTPLFIREGLNLQLNAIGGNNSTAGDDLILSGLKDKMSFSLGQFHYQTDGWRENSDLRQDIYNAFLQYSHTPSTSVQFEYRYQDAESGDLGMTFDPEDVTAARNDLDQRSGRIGIHHQMSPGRHIIASAIYRDMLKKHRLSESRFFPVYPTPHGLLPATVELTFSSIADSTASSLELQYIHEIGDNVVTLGGGYYNENDLNTFALSQKTSYLQPGTSDVWVEIIEPPGLEYIEEDPRFKNLYIYSFFTLPARMSMTLGAAFEDFESKHNKNQQLGPKFGLSWDPWKNLTIRGAYLKSLARPRQFMQTVEQTQVMGFNQQFDDVQGSEIEQYGVGVDVRLWQGLNIGLEFNRRDLEVPVINDVLPYLSVDEKRVHGYLYWTATDRLGVRIGHEHEKFERPQHASMQELTTQRTPVGISYHWPSGWFLDVEGTRINQEITQIGVSDRDDFWNVDTVLGYRLAKRRGKFEVIAKNMLDEDFKYYDLSFHTGDNLMPQFQPKRQVFIRFALDF
ncbi:MAG: TonB-dependent receptor [Candidatus Thiodiazotropha sp. (ex Epidulcina cf. delphinae)]|nr:TonB-dependent receptor [Candidatus Thiodiazotropha sp. (ex Epidulcina cf. delphinae)]